MESEVDVLALVREGATNRAQASTTMNKTSSRSHVMLMLAIEQRPYTVDGVESSSEAGKLGVLSVVDLAGSERVSKSGSEGVRLEEAKKINKSLSALGNCVAALTDANSTHVPFRDSKLTRLLTDSLGGNALTSLCITVGPSTHNYDETYSTMVFGSRAMDVRNHAKVNEVEALRDTAFGKQRGLYGDDLDDGGEKAALLKSNSALHDHIAQLTSQLAEMKQHVSAVGGAQVVAPAASWQDGHAVCVEAATPCSSQQVQAIMATPVAAPIPCAAGAGDSFALSGPGGPGLTPAVVRGDLGGGSAMFGVSGKQAAGGIDYSTSANAANKYTDVIRRLQMEIVKRDSQIEQLKAQLLQAQLRRAEEGGAVSPTPTSNKPFLALSYAAGGASASVVDPAGGSEVAGGMVGREVTVIYCQSSTCRGHVACDGKRV